MFHVEPFSGLFLFKGEIMGFGNSKMPVHQAHDGGGVQEQQPLKGSMAHPDHQSMHEGGTPHPHHGGEADIAAHIQEHHGLHPSSLASGHGEPDEDDMPPARQNRGGFKSVHQAV